MALFATIERDSAEAVRTITLAHLASDFRDKRSSDPQKQLNVLIYGYLTATAASDSVKQDIERGLMSRSLALISKTLLEMGVPIDNLYMGEMVFSGPKGRMIDLFLEQQGESRHPFPSNPPGTGQPIPTVNPPKPVKDAEIDINSSRELSMEITAYSIKSGKRTLIPEVAFKSTTGISPVEISKGFGAELTLWQPKLESVLRKLGQEGIADKIEFAVKITGGGALTKEFAKQISIEAAAALQAALTFNITIPGTNYELPVELSYSYGVGYKGDLTDPTGGGVSREGQGMIKVTIFRFKSW